MPEGDTIYRTAAQLRTALDGRLIEKAESRDPQLEVNLLAGRRIGGIEARGKHLLIHLESGHAIHTHLGMTGSWHVYPLGTVWRKPAYRADLVLHLADRAAVCFTPKTLELLSAAGHSAPRSPHASGPRPAQPRVRSAGCDLAVAAAQSRADRRSRDESDAALRDRQRLQVRALVPGANQSVRGRWQVERRAARAIRESGPAVAAKESERVSPAHTVWARRSTAVGLRPAWRRLSPLRDGNRDAAPRRLGTLDVLVPRLSASECRVTGASPARFFATRFWVSGARPGNAGTRRFCALRGPTT